MDLDSDEKIEIQLECSKIISADSSKPDFLNDDKEVIKEYLSNVVNQYQDDIDD